MQTFELIMNNHMQYIFCKMHPGGNIYCIPYVKPFVDVIIRAMTSQISRISTVCLAVCSDAHQRKHQNSASLALVRGIRRWLVNSPHKRPIMRKMFPFDDVIMIPYGTRCVVSSACIVPKPLLKVLQYSGLQDKNNTVDRSHNISLATLRPGGIDSINCGFNMNMSHGYMCIYCSYGKVTIQRYLFNLHSRVS